MSKLIYRLHALIFIGIVTITILSGCGTSKFVGTWYPIDYPDSAYLQILEDNTLWNSEADGISAVWSESGNSITITYSNDSKMSAKLGDFAGEIALEFEDGSIWIQDYDRAVELSISRSEID